MDFSQACSTAVYWNVTDIDGVRPVIRLPIESDTIRSDTLKLEAGGEVPVAISQFTVANSPTEKPPAFATYAFNVPLPAEYTPKTRSAGTALPEATITFVSICGAFVVAFTETPAGRCTVTCAPIRGTADGEPTVLTLTTAFVRVAGGGVLLPPPPFPPPPQPSRREKNMSD
jgi:hypothetical protein